MHIILLDFKIQMDHLNMARRSDQKRENFLCSGFCHPSRPQSKNQTNKKEIKVLRPCQRTKKVMEHEGDGNTNCNWCD